MNKLISALMTLRNAIAAVWEPGGQRTIAQIVEENFCLSAKTEGDPGRYDVENNPYWRKVMNSCDNPEVQRVTILKSTQVGGTLLSFAIMLALAIINPSPGMYVLPTRDEFKIQRNRLYFNALASGDCFRKLVPPKSRWSMDVVELGPMNLNAAWAGSEQRLRGKPCRFVWLGECDVMRYTGDAGNPHKSAEERTKQFFGKLIGKESTPVGDESHIFSEWEKSNQQRWKCKCPHCGRRQALGFFVHKTGPHAGRGGIVGYREKSIDVDGRQVEGALLEPDDARQQAHYVCLNGCRIDQPLKNWLVKTGIWCPKGQWIADVPFYGPFPEGVTPSQLAADLGLYDPDGRWLGPELEHGPWPQGVYEHTLPILQGEPERLPTHSGFHVWTIMQSKITLGDIAAAYINHVLDGKLRDFFQNWLGWRYRTGQRVREWEQIAKTFTRSYQSNTIPDKVWFLTGAADVQEDRVYWSVMGWGPYRTRYLIAWNEIFQAESGMDDDEGEGILLASDLKKLIPAMMHRRWAVDGVNPRGKTQMMVRMAGIDSNYRPGEVHDLVRSFQPGVNPDKKRLRCIRGDKLPIGQTSRVSVIEKNTRTGKPYPGGMHQWQLNRTHYQDNLSQTLLAAPNQVGALHLPGDILTSGRRLLRQLANLKKDEKGLYQMINGQVGKDHRDLFGYHEAVADWIVGSAGWTEKAWREQERDRVQELKRLAEKKESANER